MKGTVTGLLLAVAFLVAIFAIARVAPHAPLAPSPEKAAVEIERGFVGIKMIGAWQLVCLASPEIIGGAQAPAAPAPPVPLSLGPNASAPAVSDAPLKHAATPEPAKPVPTISLGRCRVTLEYRQKSARGRVIATVSFRLAGRANKLLMIVRLPAIAKKGDELVLAMGHTGMKIKVAGCQKGGCVAAGALTPNAQAGLLSAPKAEIILPPLANGKRRGLPVPVGGLGPAITAMYRAES